MNKKYLYYSSGISILLIIIIIALTNYLPPEVPLFYGEPVGEAQLTSSSKLVIAPLISLSISIINFFLLKIVKDIFLQKLLMITSLFIAILIGITVVKIIFLVGFF